MSVRISEPVGKTLLNNSTETPLSGSAIYTGEWIKIEHYSCVICVAKSDVAGTLYMEFIHVQDPQVTPSTDATPDSSLSYSVRAGIDEPPHQLQCARGWFRSRYFNGASDQSSFKLISTAGNHSHIVAPSNLILAQNADATVVRTISDELDIAQNKRSGFAVVNIFGRNSDIDTPGEIPSDVWSGGGVYTGFPVGDDELVTIVSSSTNDTSSGSGARTVEIDGLDTNGMAQFEIITLNGQTPVDSVNTYTRVYRVKVLTSGSSNQAFNDGTLTVAHKTTTANVFAVVPVGVNQSQAGCYTIPAGKTGYLKFFEVFLERSISSSAKGAVFVRNNGAAPRLLRPFSLTQSSSHSVQIYGGLVLPALTDIAIRITEVSTSNVDVLTNFDIILIDD